MPVELKPRPKMSTQEAAALQAKKKERAEIRDHFLRIANNPTTAYRVLGKGEPVVYDDGDRTTMEFGLPLIPGKNVKSGGRAPWTMLVTIRRDENDVPIYQVDPEALVKDWNIFSDARNEEIKVLTEEKVQLQARVKELETELSIEK